MVANGAPLHLVARRAADISLTHSRFRAIVIWHERLFRYLNAHFLTFSNAYFLNKLSCDFY
jgi:hypothetical protein